MKTHVLAPEPEMDVRYLADYMAGSDRRRRNILTDAKWRPRARLMQHREAKAVIVNALAKGHATKAFFEERAHFIRNKIATDDFDALTNEANADYLKQFSKVVEAIDLPGVEFHTGKTYVLGKTEGLKVPFVTNLTLRRITKTNKVTTGSLMLRYSKGRALPKKVADYQSAIIHGLLGTCAIEDGAQLDRSLCLVLDGFLGASYCAPSNSVTLFKNTLAACATIADAWPNVKPPLGAIV
jgi:hypothetical protein